MFKKATWVSEHSSTYQKARLSKDNLLYFSFVGLNNPSLQIFFNDMLHLKKILFFIEQSNCQLVQLKTCSRNSSCILSFKSGSAQVKLWKPILNIRTSNVHNFAETEQRPREMEAIAGAVNLILKSFLKLKIQQQLDTLNFQKYYLLIAWCLFQSEQFEIFRIIGHDIHGPMISVLKQFLHRK